MDDSKDQEITKWSCARCGSMIIPGDKECKDCGRFSGHLIGQLITDLHGIICENKDVQPPAKFNKEGSFTTNCGHCNSIHVYVNKPCPVCRKHRARIFFKTFLRLLLASIFPKKGG